MNCWPHRAASPRKNTAREAFDIMIAQWLFFGFATLAVLGALGLILFAIR